MFVLPYLEKGRDHTEPDCHGLSTPPASIEEHAVSAMWSEFFFFFFFLTDTMQRDALVFSVEKYS